MVNQHFGNSVGVREQGMASLKADVRETKRPRARDGGQATSDIGRRDSHVATALRTAYEEAVREDVPPEFLDLLGKLA